MVADHAINRHEAGDQEGDEEADGPGWLAHWIHRIDDGVTKPTESRHPNQHHGQDHIGVRQRVEEGDNHEGQNVLQVVQMGSPDPFHLRILLARLHALWSVLGVLKGLQRVGG